MASISLLEQKVLREAYPHLSFTDDLDIERYFELRRVGQLGAALSVYNNILRVKYPDDTIRVKLLSFYRTKDARFYELLTENLTMLAETTITKIKRGIVYITDTMLAVDMNNVFQLIQVTETLISQISSDRFAVIAETEKFTRFAGILDFRLEEMKRSSELIRMYITDTLSSVNNYRNEQARLKQKQLEAEKRKSLVPAFDFSKIVFTKTQIAQIVLPFEHLSAEDTVLAYIIKYWDKVLDRNFENMILLYSRKYKTRHYDIYNALKTARTHRWQDAELLQSVLSNVVSGYYYNISGDVYLNRSWQRIKPVLESGNTLLWTPPKKTLLLPDTTDNAILQHGAEAPVKKTAATHHAGNRMPRERNDIIQTVPKDTHIPTMKQYNTTKAAASHNGVQALITPEELKAEQEKQAEKYALMKAEEARYFAHRQPDFRENARKLAEHEKAFLEKQRLEARKDRVSITAAPQKLPAQKAKKATPSTKKQTAPAAAQKTKKAAAPVKSAPTKRAATASRTSVNRAAAVNTVKTQTQKSAAAPKTNFFVPRKNNNFDPAKINSIENMIKKATGKNYVVYKEVFFKTIRTSIRHVLSATRMQRQRQSLFKTEQNTAENIIYVFLERNYTNLYQTWETSNAKETVYQLGFNVKSIEQIIAHWANEVLKK